MIRLVDVDSCGEEAVAVLYQLLKERPPEASISHDALPSLEEHRAFVRSQPYRVWFLARDGEQTVGAIYATERNEIGIAILRQHQGKGHAKAAIRQLIAQLPPLPASSSLRRGRYVANVAPDNAVSHALFRELGGKVIQWTYEL
jgi:RimJ/RimL family protein N-acetyltransferase